MGKNVALALSSGGPRGFAYIGAIEELQGRGYTITSVSGASAGSLIGGIFAAGGMQAFKEWIEALDPLQVMTLMDVSISKNYLVKGEKIIDAIRERVPEVNIEDLPIPFAAVATDLHTGEEIVFRSGPLFTAIRASISIPSMFRPVKWQGRTLVDGGMANTLPLNRAKRTPGDILIGFNVNEIDATQVRGYLNSLATLEANEEALKIQTRQALTERPSAQAAANLKRVLTERIDSIKREKKLLEAGKENYIPLDADDNYLTVLRRSFGLMNHTIARQGIELCPPDILVNMAFDSYHGVYGYTHATEIIEKGRTLMREALDKYEGRG